ncbi:MAG: efflux RND transporter periplasmic adaptor subunit [Planctomycetota bacterium]|nr:efflux RND transporter periplasmic adaptor subunit [Planctomycetota bacterium]
MRRPLAFRAALPLLALTLLASACTQEASSANNEPLAGAKRREPTRVVVHNLEQREMVRRLETTTRIESMSAVQVYPRAGGIVAALYVEEGSRVEIGQVLAQLDDRDARLRLDDAKAQEVDAKSTLPKLALAVREAEARLETARRNGDQAKRDHDRNVALSKGEDDRPALISPKDLEASQLAQDRAQAEVGQNLLSLERAKVEQSTGETALVRSRVAVERAELEFSYTRIVASIAGVVAERSVKVGDTVSTATLAFALTDLSQLRAVFYRPQREFGMFVDALSGHSTPRNGEGEKPVAELSLEATTEAMPGLRFAGQIERIAPTIDAASGNFRVTARMTPEAVGNPGARLLPGMLVRLEIITERHPDALVVPKRAVRREGDRATIFVVEGAVARALLVTEGFTDDERVEVFPAAGAKLAPGARVIVVGNRDLEDGAEVQVAQDESAPAAETAR